MLLKCHIFHLERERETERKIVVRRVGCKHQTPQVVHDHISIDFCYKERRRMQKAPEINKIPQ